MVEARQRQRTRTRTESAFRRLRAELDELSGICAALSDFSDLSRLWRRIVSSAQILLNVDGCTYYRLRDGRLHFEIVLSRSLGLITDATQNDPARFQPIPVHLEDGRVDPNSFAARVAATGKTIHIKDVTKAPNYSNSQTRKFDLLMDYRTRSVLTVPVRFRAEPPIGVLQFINAKNSQDEVTGFDKAQEEIAHALASLIVVAQRLAQAP